MELRRIRVLVWDQYEGRFREPLAGRGERITRSANAPVQSLLIIVDAVVGGSAQQRPIPPIALRADEGAWAESDAGLVATFTTVRRVFSAEVKPNVVFEGTSLSVPFLIRGRRCEPLRLRAALVTDPAKRAPAIEELVEIDCGE